jgi:predicted amidohydrolase
MKITVLLAQFPVTLSIPENLAAIQQVIEAAHPGDWLIFPEGAVSGYSSDITFLAGQPGGCSWPGIFRASS